MEDTKRDISNSPRNNPIRLIGSKILNPIIDNARMAGIKKAETDIEKLEGALNLKGDSNKLKAMDFIENETDKVTLVLSMQEDGTKYTALSKINDENNKMKIVLTIRQEYYKVPALNNFKDEKNILPILLTFRADEQKQKSMKLLSNPTLRLELALSMKDKEIRDQYINEILGEKNSVKIVTGLQTDENKIEMREYFISQFDKTEITASMQSDEHKMEFIRMTMSERNKAVVAATLESIEYKEEVLETIKEEDAKAVIIASYKDDNRKMEFIETCKNEYAKAIVAASLEDERYKDTLLETLEEESSKAILIESYTEDDKKIEFIKQCKDEFLKTRVCCSLQSEELKLDYIGQIKSLYNILQVVNTIQNEQLKIEVLNLFEDKLLKIKIASQLSDMAKLELISISDDEYYKIKIAETIENDDIKKESLYFIDSEKAQKDIMNTMKDEDKIEESKKELEDEKIKVEELKLLSDDEKISQINSVKRESYKLEIVDSIQEESKKLDFLMTQTEPGFCTKYRSICSNIDFLKNNIELFMEKEGASENIPEGIIEELFAKNNSILKTINFNMLETKYIELFGKDKINLIGCYPNVQNNILKLDEKKCNLFYECIDNYEKNMETEEWTPMASSILMYMNTKEYDTLIDSLNLEELDENDISLITQRLQERNWFDISNMDEIRNFEQVCESKGSEILESNASLETKKQYVCQKIFGHDYYYTQHILEHFNGDTKDEQLNVYIECLKKIDEIKNEDILKEIFESCEFVQADKSIITKQLKNEYGKLYNEGLYVPKEADLIDEEFNIYDAGTDFKIIMTSIGAYHQNEATDYKKDWNRPEISTQHVCTSYIRNDMIGTAPINNICYGFSEMKPDSLLVAGNRDVYSNRNSFVSAALSSKEQYYSADELVNHTEIYNELDYNRIQDGVKKQPDYILVFKENGQIPNMEEAKEASKQWGGLPIVVVDKDKCLEAERQKVESMIEEYSQNPNEELAKQIRQKVRNNRVTRANFCEDIENMIPKERYMSSTSYYKYSEEKVVQEEEIEEKNDEIEITEESLEEIYDQTSATDRKRSASRMKDLYRQISEIARGEHDEK